MPAIKVSPRPNNYLEFMDSVHEAKGELYERFKSFEKWGAPQEELDKIDEEWRIIHEKLRLWRAVHGHGTDKRSSNQLLSSLK